MTQLQAPFEWDHWEEAALERGLDKELASLGRATMREAVQHNWSPQITNLCSWGTLDNLFTEAPRFAKRLCELLLETDGLRVAYVEEGEHNTADLIELDHFQF